MVEASGSVRGILLFWDNKVFDLIGMEVRDYEGTMRMILLGVSLGLIV